VSIEAKYPFKKLENLGHIKIGTPCRDIPRTLEKLFEELYEYFKDHDLPSTGENN
jgi:hypothetical protein